MKVNQAFLDRVRRQYLLPDSVSEFLKTCPYVGGTHDWIFEAALRLRTYKTPDEAVDLLLSATAHCHHSHEQEIVDAVCGVYNSSPNYEPRPKRPSANPDLIEQVATKETVRVIDLVARSPLPVSEIWGAEYYVGALFPASNPILCAGRAVNDFDNDRFKTWCRQGINLSACSFIVPSPMLTYCGRNMKEKKKSNTNTGPRVYACLEWDFPFGKWGLSTFDLCASLIAYVGRKYPLTMAVSSGSKSVHGWWRCRDWTPEQLREFFDYGRTLGCDPKMETISQFTRMPAGTNNNTKKTQSVLYFDPTLP